MRAAVPQCCSLAGLLPSTCSEHPQNAKDWARSLENDNRTSFLLSSRRREIRTKAEKTQWLKSYEIREQKELWGNQRMECMGSVGWRSGKASSRS